MREGRRRFLQQVSVALGGIALSLMGRPARAGEFTVRQTSAARMVAAVATYPIPASDGAEIDAERAVIVVRWQGAVYAFSLSCPHQKTLLKWKKNDSRFQCPKHKSKYQPDGTFISGKATRGMDRYAIHKQGETIQVDLTKRYREDEQRSAWMEAVVRL